MQILGWPTNQTDLPTSALRTCGPPRAARCALRFGASFDSVFDDRVSQETNAAHEDLPADQHLQARVQ